MSEVACVIAMERFRRILIAWDRRPPEQQYERSYVVFAEWINQLYEHHQLKGTRSFGNRERPRNLRASDVYGCETLAQTLLFVKATRTGN